MKPKLLDTVDDMLANDIARLMVMVRQEESLMPSQAVKGGAFEGTMNGPFGHGYGEGAGEGIDDVEWVVGRTDEREWGTQASSSGMSKSWQ